MVISYSGVNTNFNSAVSLISIIDIILHCNFGVNLMLLRCVKHLELHIFQTNIIKFSLIPILLLFFHARQHATIDIRNEQDK